MSDTRYPIRLRKHISMEKILSLRKFIKKSINYHKGTNKSLSEKIQNLYTDIINSLSHVFGNHDKCQDYLCSAGKTGDSDSIKDLKRSSLWLQLVLITSNFARHARST